MIRVDAWCERHGLTRRHRDVIHARIDGYRTSLQIAELLGISHNTVKSYVTCILKRTGDETLADTAMRAIRETIGDDK